MKKSLKIAFISLASLLLTSGICLSIPFSMDNYKSNISEENLSNNNELKYKDYFKNKSSLVLNEDKKLKNKITKIINDYRLYEWNNYFKNQNKDLIKSNIFEPSYIDYNKNDYTNKIKPNSIFKNYDIEYTKIYLNQDEQFRFFNDFINIINEENSQNQEDFLYLRWQYYAYEAATRYHKLIYNGKPIYEINIADWVNAITAMIISGGTDFTKISQLLKVMFQYYGIDITFKNITSDIEIASISLVKPNITHALLCSKDMVMRISSFSDYDIQKYPLFKQKAKRIKQINEDMQDYYNLLTNSFIGDIDGSNLGNNVDIKDVTDSLDAMKDMASELLDMIVGRTKLDLNHYANVSQINKYREKLDVKNIIGKN